MSASRRATWPLSVAGSDPSGGAGLQADLKVFAAFGLSGGAVPTAITVQGPRGVRGVHPLPARLVARQLAAVLADLRPAAVKIGMLPDAEVVRAVARALQPLSRAGVPLVLDPVLSSSSGAALLSRRGWPALLDELFPLAAVVTPNLDEAAALLGWTSRRVQDDPAAAAEALRATGAGAVLLKGGHARGARAVDWLATDEGVARLAAPRVARRTRVHGTGCALSAALAALLARGVALPEAAARAKRAVRRALAGSTPAGRGVRLLDFSALPGR